MKAASIDPVLVFAGLVGMTSLLLLAACTGDDDTPSPSHTATTSSSTPSLEDLLAAFDPTPAALDPSTTPCPALHTGPRFAVGDEANFGSCATWDDAWDDEYGFVVTIDYFAADPPESFAYFLPTGATAVTLPTAGQPDLCDRRNFHLQLFVLLPSGTLPLDSLAREADPIEGPPCD